MKKLDEYKTIKLKKILLVKIDEYNDYAREEEDLEQKKRWKKQAEIVEEIYNNLFIDIEEIEID